MIEHLLSSLRRFRRNSRGVAAVEFALILPLLLLLYLGSVELSSIISVDKRIATVSGSLGDLVARTDESISTSTIDDYFLAASTTMAPYSSDDVGQVVTSVYVDDEGVAKVVWSRGYNGATAHSENSVYPLKEEFKKESLDSYVIVSEAQTSYSPISGYVFDTAFDLYHEYYFLPRFGDEIACSGC